MVERDKRLHLEKKDTEIPGEKPEPARERHRVGKCSVSGQQASLYGLCLFAINPLFAGLNSWQPKKPEWDLE